MFSHKVFATVSFATAALVAVSMATSTLASERVLPLRESKTVLLTSDQIALQVWKIKGYEVVIKLAGTRHTLKLGQTLELPGSTCRVTFEEAAPETRIARFKTDC